MSDSRPQSDAISGPSPAVASPEQVVADLAQAPSRRDTKIPKAFGRYRIEDTLGRGGMGAVFRAHDTQLNRTVALKIPFLGDDGDDTRQRFFREARAAAALHHANICPVYDVGEHQGLPYLTMAFVEGKSLAKVLTDGPPIPPSQAALLVRKLALAMHEAHTHGVIHRDLKPANVMLRPGGEPVIMDFGLARRGDDRASEGLTRQGDVIGTLEYMSPEQLEGDNAHVGPPADVYALGVLLYEVLTGKRPFTGNTVNILTAILMKPPPRPSELRPGVPTRLDDICLKAMGRTLDQRYASMAEFAAALTEFIRAPAGSSVVPMPPAASASGAGGAAAVATPRPDPSTRPVRATAAAEPATAPKDEPAPASAPRSKSGSKRKKKEKEKAEAKARSNKAVVMGVVAGGGVILIAGIAVALWPSSTPTTARQPDVTPPPSLTPAKAPTPAPAPVTKDNKTDKTDAKGKTDTKGKATTPAPKTPTKPPEVRFAAQEFKLAVGEPREVTFDVQWNGYTGPLAVRLDGPPELRVAPGGALTVRPNESAPKLTLMLTAQPADPNPALTLTATTDKQRDTVTARLPVGFVPSPCDRVLAVADRANGGEAVALTPDGSLALVGGPDRPTPKDKDGKIDAKAAADAHAIRVWDLRRGAQLAPLVGHTGRVTQVVVSADGKTALTVSADETVALWNLALGKRETQSSKQALKVLTAAVSPDGKTALAVYPKAIVRVNLEKFLPVGQPIKTAQVVGGDADDAVLAAAVSPDRKALLGGADGKLALVELPEKASDKTKAKHLVGHKEAVQCAAFAPGGATAVTGGGGALQVGTLRPGKDHVVCVWDTAAAALKWRAGGHAAPVVSVAFDAAGKRVASGGSDGEVRVWGAAGEPLATFKGHAGRVTALAFTADGTGLMSAAADGTVRQWRLP